MTCLSPSLSRNTLKGRDMPNYAGPLAMRSYVWRWKPWVLLQMRHVSCQKFTVMFDLVFQKAVCIHGYVLLENQVQPRCSCSLLLPQNLIIMHGNTSANLIARVACMSRRSVQNYVEFSVFEDWWGAIYALSIFWPLDQLFGLSERSMLLKYWP